MRTWPKLIASGLVLTIGLIACFAPGDDDVVEIVAPYLPSDTPLLVAMSSPDVLLTELARASELEALRPAYWTRHGLDPSQPLTIARLPGEASLWMISAAVADEVVVAAGADDLLNALGVSHRVRVDGARVHALVSSGAPEEEAWRAAVSRFENPNIEESLASSDTLQLLGHSSLLVHGHAGGISDSFDLPSWAIPLVEMLGDCTVRGTSEAEVWEVDVGCASPEGSLITSLLGAPQDGLTVSENDTEAVVHGVLEPSIISKLWHVLADHDAYADGAHTLLMDVAQSAGLSLSQVWSEALTGEVALAVTRWPMGRRRPGFVGRLGLEDTALVMGLLDAWREIAADSPGVRVQSEEVAGLDGWSIEWLRHRGHDLGWVVEDDQLWFSYGSADLEDALAVGRDEPWEPASDRGAARISVGELLDLEPVLGDLDITVDVAESELLLTLVTTRPSDVSAQRTLGGLVDSGLAAYRAQVRAALASQLSRLCDTIDLHAIDHGLPDTLAVVLGDEMHLDPWGHPFDYAQPARRRSHHRYDLCSRGPDGVSGTGDDVCHE